ncbi:MAG: hypothetical protein ACREIP_21755 [Alphaproteobacteria bacterium]
MESLLAAHPHRVSYAARPAPSGIAPMLDAPIRRRAAPQVHGPICVADVAMLWQVQAGAIAEWGGSGYERDRRWPSQARDAIAARDRFKPRFE